MQGYYDIPLYSIFKNVAFISVPQSLLVVIIPPGKQEDIDDSLYEYGKYGPQPQSPSPTVSDASSIVFSICPSNDSNEELGAVSDHSVNDDPIHTELESTNGKGISDGELGHVIKDCVYYEKKMARAAAFKSTRVIHADVRQATPAWTNSNRVNKANQFTPRPVQLSNIRPNLSTASNTIKTGRVNVNTGHGNVSSGSVHVNSGTQIKSGASRFNTGKQHVNSGSMHVNSGTQIKSGGSRFNTGHGNVNSGRVHVNTARVNRLHRAKWVLLLRPQQVVFGEKQHHTPIPIDHPLKHMEHRGIFDSGCSGHMTGNRAHLEDYQELSKVGSVTFGGSKGSISGKGTIRLGNLVFDDVAFVKELGHFNLFSISQICDKKLNVLFTEKECFVVSSDFKMPDENQVLLKVPRQHNMYTFDMKTVDSSKGYTCLLAKASSNEAKLWHRRTLPSVAHQGDRGESTQRLTDKGAA
ncbi:hypothetical protein Tco_0195160 [Tanacetum coccineum]